MKTAIRSYTKSIIFISSVISVGLALFIAINANRYITRMSKNNSELYDSYKISELMKLFRANMGVIEAKQRGYIVTGDGKFLEEYKFKETETKTYLKSMEKYFSGKPEEEAFYKLKDLTYKKLMEVKDLSRAQGVPGVPQESEQGVISTMDEINQSIDEINESLSQTTKKLIDNSVEYVGESEKWSYLEIAIGILIAVSAMIVLFRDVNTRNRLEAELRVAKKQAENNALMKEQFMANMSHEIRTPMNAILGFSSLMQKTKLDETQAGYLSAIKTSGSNLLNIINDILDFSKIEAGQVSIEKIPFSVHSLVDSLRVMFSEKAGEKHIGFEVEISPQLPKLVFGDPTRLTQILVNLTGNAIKFTDNGSVKVSCEVKSIEHDVANLVFRVKDTGIGIPANKIDDVFVRFRQANSDTTRMYGGTGLGLSIVKSLVEIQNGTITVKSKEGAGSEFIVSISYPVSYEDSPEVRSMKESSESRTALRPAEILLAEDNLLNQKLAKTLLESFGLKVDIAGNGQIAIDMLKGKQYELVLMDMQMPVLDGYDTARAIRNELRLDVPVIAMTAHILPGEKEKCISCGMNDYISKPFREQELYDMVRHYIGEGNGKQAAAPAAEKTQSDAKVVNLDELYALARGNKEFIREMIGIFLEQNGADLETLEKAISEKDYETIQATSHRMKTSVGFMGLKQLLSPLAEMEETAITRSGIETIGRSFGTVKSVSLLAVEEMKNELGKPELN